MILWTIQDIAVWEQLEATGVYTTPSDRIEFPEHEDTDCHHAHYAYRWLSEQMRKRVGPPPKGVEFPVWAWYKQQERPDGKPDMRCSHYIKDLPCVRMKLDVPDWEVMITDFEDWHYALNYWHCSTTEQESDEFEKWHESLGISFHDIGDWSLQSPELTLVRERVEKSWERIIGINPVNEQWHFPWKKRSFQATFWTLRHEHVLSVERFISR